jgi:hypothetical protein
MIGRATLIWMLLALTAGASLFVLKYEVKSMEEELARIDRQTLDNLETIHVLKAEWSYLNRPARLEDLGRRLLSLEQIDVAQTAKIDDIPMRPDPGPESGAHKTDDDPDGHAPSGPDNSLSPAAGHVPPLLATFSPRSNSTSSRRAQ